MATPRRRSPRHFFVWVGLIGAMAIGFNTWLDHQENPNRNPQTVIDEQGSREVTLEQNRAGHYLAQGKINGHPVTFMLDTGASHVSIPESVARDIGLTAGTPMIARTANGTIQVHRTQLGHVSIGSITQRDVRGSINPYMDGEKILLGMSFLGDLDFTQSGGTLTLRQQ